MAMTRDPKKGLQTPIVTPNTLWTTDDPRAYGGVPLAASAEYEVGGTREFNVVGAYVVPDDEYNTWPEVGEVVVPVPPYCVAKFVWESTA